MRDYDIVMQGPMFDGTADTARHYASLDFVNTVIVSCWDSETRHVDGERIVVVKSPSLSYPGIGNRNCQIVSSRNGLAKATAPYAIKIRTDQRISAEGMRSMRDFFEKFRTPPVKFSDGSGPSTRIHVIGMYTAFPFHPQDHVFWGATEDVRMVFDIPLDTPPRETWTGDYSKALRANMYIGMHYYAKFDPIIKTFISDPYTYLVDNAPKYHEAMAVYNKYRDDVFKVFPRTDMWWEKYQRSYPFEWGVPYTEYWHDEPWR